MTRYQRSSRAFFWGLTAFLTTTLWACGTAPQTADHRLLNELAAGSGNAAPQPTTCTDALLVTDALKVLKISCYSCHGAGGKSDGGPKDVTDLQALVTSGVVVPKDPVNSPLLAAIAGGKMPPSGNDRLADAQILALTNWVASGAPVLTADQATAAQTSCQSGPASSPNGAPPAPATPAPAPAGPAPAGPAPSTPPSPNPAPPGASNVLALDAQTVLGKFCAGCHDGASSSGGLGTITNLQHLVDAGFVIPGDLAKSKIYSRLTNVTSPMPPAGKPAPTQADIATIAAWILANTPTNTTPPPGPSQTLSPTDIFTMVAQDLQKVAATSNSNAPFTRYISFAVMANNGASGLDLQNYSNGIARLLNSLSTNPRVTKPVPINADNTVFRLDIRNYNWSQQNWEDILKAYPYATLQRSASLLQEFRLLAQTDLPVVNGDWFSFTVAQPPLYNELLQLGSNEASLEQILGFSIVTDLQQTLDDTASLDTKVLRAGFARSGVALNNRAFERHVTRNGAYWRSFDFADPGPNANAAQQAAKNVFASPLGSARIINSNISFQEDAGEIIFSLPNGLQGYFLVDGQANRLDAAALNVAQDPSRQQKSILNGYSCMGCHAPGILPKHDEVATVAAGRGFSPDALTAILRLYGDSQSLSAAFTSDTTRYLSALGQASFDPSNTRPMVLAGNYYEKDITMADAAAVLGLSSPTFQGLFNNASQGLKEALAGIASGGTVTREVFEAQFPQLVVDFFGNIPAP